MQVEKDRFGTTPAGQPVTRFRLANAAGLSVDLLDFGALVSSVKQPDRDGARGEVSLGFDELAGYLTRHPYFGATVGRYANRIARGEFSLEGKIYRLATNNGPNHLHGGESGFDRALWAAESFQSPGLGGVRFRHRSPDGDEGYPGTLDVEVVYSLDEASVLAIEYSARTDRPTIVNLTNHTYWNLCGAGSRDVLAHELELFADAYLPVDEGLIPTGERRSVNNTPLDFRRAHTLGERLAGTDGGYDHCYVLSNERRAEPVLAARVHDPESGRTLEIATTEPGLQLYTGNFLDGVRGAGGRIFEKHGGFCLEAQLFPDSPNQPDFPSALLRPGEIYRQRTTHRFLVR